MFGLFPRVVGGNGKLLRQVPLSNGHLAQVLQNGTALHLRAMGAIGKRRAHVLPHAPCPEPHGTNQPGDQPLLVILEESGRQLAPNCWADCFILVHLVDQHDPLLPSALLALLLHTGMRQTLRGLEGKLLPQNESATLASRNLGRAVSGQ